MGTLRKIAELSKRRKELVQLVRDVHDEQVELSVLAEDFVMNAKLVEADVKLRLVEAQNQLVDVMGEINTLLDQVGR